MSDELEAAREMRRMSGANSEYYTKVLKKLEPSTPAHLREKEGFSLLRDPASPSHSDDASHSSASSASEGQEVVQGRRVQESKAGSAKALHASASMPNMRSRAVSKARATSPQLQAARSGDMREVQNRGLRLLAVDRPAIFGDNGPPGSMLRHVLHTMTDGPPPSRRKSRPARLTHFDSNLTEPAVKSTRPHSSPGTRTSPAQHGRLKHRALTPKQQLAFTLELEALEADQQAEAELVSWEQSPWWGPATPQAKGSAAAVTAAASTSHKPPRSRSSVGAVASAKRVARRAAGHGPKMKATRKALPRGANTLEALVKSGSIRKRKVMRSRSTGGLPPRQRVRAKTAGMQRTDSERSVNRRRPASSAVDTRMQREAQMKRLQLNEQVVAQVSMASPKQVSNSAQQALHKVAVLSSPARQAESSALWRETVQSLERDASDANLALNTRFNSER